MSLSVRLFIVLVPAGLLALLNATMIGVALPQILEDLGGDIATGQWITTAYLLAVGAGIPVAGWAHMRFGLVPIWTTAMALFLLGALGASTASGMQVLIAARAVQGFGGGMLEPLMVTAIVGATPASRMGRTMAAMGLVMEMGPLSGPAIGGAILESLGWRGLFLAFAIVSAFLIAAGVGLLPRTERAPRKLDIIGLALFTAAVLTGLGGLSRAAGPDGFDLAAITALVVSATALTTLVTWARRREANAIVDLRIFSAPGFAPAITIMALLGAAIFPVFFGLPQFYQNVLGHGAATAGLLMIPYGIGTLTSMPVMGILSDRLPARGIVFFGAVLSLSAFLLLVMVGSTAAVPLLMTMSLATGLGLGTVVGPTAAAVYRSLPPDLVASGSTVMFTVLQIGGAFGVALLSLLIGGDRWEAAAGTGPFVVPVAATAVIALASLRLR